jgi:transketolase
MRRSSQTEIEEIAHRIRRTVLEMCRGRGQGYAGQGLGLADVVACLCFDELADGYPKCADRLVLSTGHSAIALYAALHELGVYELDELRTYGMDHSRIDESPIQGTPGFEITGGSLGQGLSQAVGMALSNRITGTAGRIYCILSDGELQEGQVWEAIQSAGHYRLGSLTALIDNNDMQADGITREIMGVEPVGDRLAAFGWGAVRIDGNDPAAIHDALAGARDDTERPTAIVCDTQPGKGVPSFEAYEKVHYIRADAEVWERVISELEARGSGEIQSKPLPPDLDYASQLTQAERPS